MKKIKLQLTAVQVGILGDMLQYCILRPEVRRSMELEYYTLLEWYHRQSHRWLFLTVKPLPMSYAEACALCRVMGTMGFPVPGAGGVATAVLWQLSGKFGECAGRGESVKALRAGKALGAGKG
jgi:hypothetical protein